MTELLAPQPGDRVLELGTGSGYQAAILAALGARRDQPRAPRGPRRPRPVTGSMRSTCRAASTIRITDGSLGDPAGAPWDGIIVTAAAPSIPTELREQLADGGRLVIPVGPRDHQILTRSSATATTGAIRRTGPCVFVPLIGPGGFPDEPSRTPIGRHRGWF